ncbi:MAG: trehalose-6-phosphate synthase [Candidatus Rokubacteria bacterium]|nr:trehalose-6-phosphate synthase [Candidatus Rokubacteria bacterium]MBI2552889.1 trehalose-6-phosphate synthase [Candidatus Rokubacteria bacterium]
MRLVIRLLGAIWVSSLVIIAGFAFLQVQSERSRMLTDLERRAWLMGEGLKEAIEPAILRGQPARIERILKKFGSPRRGIAVYDQFAGLLVATPDLAPRLPSSLPIISQALTTGQAQKGVETLGGQKTYLYAVPLQGEERPAGALVIFLDASQLEFHLSALWQQNAVRLMILASVVSLLTLLVVRWSITHPLRRMAEWAQQMRAGKTAPPPVSGQLFGSLASEFTELARSLDDARAAAEREALLRLEGEALWTAERLKQFVRSQLNDTPLFAVSNREPLIHQWRGRKIETVEPASGLVTALEPIMHACGGLWIAHGSGDADRETVDAQDKVGVPPEQPAYTLKRVWLTKEEEDGYYNGFANEGLWPLCHIAHTRPVFRASDWAAYRRVNEKFAEALLEEMEGTERPYVLIQDYHFALLPRLVKDRRPDARIVLFWHIPWPNPEAFGICPWQQEILLGMLGADLIGFHIQFHCNNFLETVDRTIEARVDRERFGVVRGRHTTYVKPFPISVAPAPDPADVGVSRDELLKDLGPSVEFLGVGVDRIDYTKGILERLRAIERFFERYPDYRQRMVFVELAAPSRSHIKRYQDLDEEVDRAVEKINWSLRTNQWKPIAYLRGHHSHKEIWPYYRHADFCMVTSLHDGMNLVAKEYVSAAEEERGVLILSRFTGAARELVDALQVNPYHIDEMAEAIRLAIEMPPAERAIRMRRMKQIVRERNIYRWAGLLLEELTRLSVDRAGVAEV